MTKKVKLVSGSLKQVVEKLNTQGFHELYIDGGMLIQSFLKEDMIDELIITQVPVLLGGGISLFGTLPSHLAFDHITTKVLLDALVQFHYKRAR